MPHLAPLYWSLMPLSLIALMYAQTVLVFNLSPILFMSKSNPPSTNPHILSWK
uniref:ATP synthase F0 subunit 8 n=1 Tax=Ramisyllis kingghidorahi TaxID=2876589 RepID=UPI002176ABB2|nr:ATP synthase F0 subunit 8 [Ramisyllis kingghidorahi]UUF68152.1 ATP synthase F0 subunit 8 [Ramisyllis kingghidorahi]